MGKDGYVSAAKQRVSAIRLRTWTLTLAIVVTLVFYFLVTITTKQSLSWIDFLLLCTCQIVCHSLYFPDGDLFGQRDEVFVANRTAYNDKATAITKDKNIAKLREYCKVDFAERKNNYILAECGVIGITPDELEMLKQKSEKEIKHIKSFSVKEIVDGEEREKLIVFSSVKRKHLYNLIFKPLPVEENHPETILSAIEHNGNKAIKDGSTAYRRHSYIRKIMQAVIVGGVFAYITYTVRDGVGLAEIVQIIMYLTTLFTTAVMAFTSGESCSKVYKSHFYLELSNFLDAFNEWNAKPHKIVAVRPEDEILAQFTAPTASAVLTRQDADEISITVNNSSLNNVDTEESKV